MLMTALHTSRATLRRLVERQAELAAEVAKEQKQAARIEWLLNRVCGSCRRLAGQLVLFLECQGPGTGLGEQRIALPLATAARGDPPWHLRHNRWLKMLGS
jgi:hypothetical protein